MSTTKLAILRSDSMRPCPYGLSIISSCLNAGHSVYQMTPLDDVPEDEQERYKQANRRVYRHHNEGVACPFNEGQIDHKEMVNCDEGDFGAGIKEVAVRPSPYYPRVFHGMNNLYSYPIGTYTSGDTGGQQLFNGYNSYGSQDPLLMKKHAGETQHPDPGWDCFELEGVLDETEET